MTLDEPDVPGEFVGNASTVSLPAAGAPLLRAFDAMSLDGGSMGFNQGVPFKLLTGTPPDDDNDVDGSLVTLPLDSGMNDSVAASA